MQLDDIHLIDKNLILAAETAEFAQIGGAQNLAFTVIEQVFVHDLEDIHAGIPHKVHVRLDGRVAVVHLLREMEPEARGNPVNRLAFQYAINSFLLVHKNMFLPRHPDG